MVRATLALLALLITTQSATAQLADRMSHLKYVDLRDLAAFNTDLKATANAIMTKLETEPALFLNGVPRFYREGTMGPQGSTGRGMIPKDGKQVEVDVFDISRSNAQTRRDTIFSAEFEQITEEVYDNTYLFKMILFVHDSQNSDAQISGGYYFRRVGVRVSWVDGQAQIQVLNREEEIPLALTQFEILGDLTERKIVLHDTINDIWKVLPVGVGSINIRPGGETTILTAEFREGKLKKINGQGASHLPNTRVRTYPYYYKGRPFLALFDSNDNYDTNSVGIHYQITGSLMRAFVSHACIRMRDKDLYQIDAILNGGPHTELRAHILNSQPILNQYVHPMPKADSWYNAVVYSERPSPEKVVCPDRTYKVKQQGGYHTVADGDCMDMVAKVPQDTSSVIDYLSGASGVAPRPLISANMNHIPLGDNEEDWNNWDSDGGDEYKGRRQKYLCDSVGGFGGFVGKLLCGKRRGNNRDNDRGGNRHQQQEYDGAIQDPDYDNGQTQNGYEGFDDGEEDQQPARRQEQAGGSCKTLPKKQRADCEIRSLKRWLRNNCEGFRNNRDCGKYKKAKRDWERIRDRYASEGDY
jgi:hypothetical protein